MSSYPYTYKLHTLGRGEVRGGGGGGTLIFSYIHMIGSFFGFKILNFNIFGVFRKINIFWGMKILWKFLGVITKMDYIMGAFLCILRSFLKVMVQNGDFLGVAKISNIFSGCMEFLIFLWGEG